MTGCAKIRVLCVDDEPMVLDGLRLTLGRTYDVLLATSGAEGLKLLGSGSPPSVIISDMRMPKMSGAEFLKAACSVAKDSVRLLLTGHADLPSAIDAVNEGHIFRFLSKPCPPPVLLSAVAAAAEQARLVTAERVLLEETLNGSIKALFDVLALANPGAFGRAGRIKEIVREIGGQTPIDELWAVEVAAMLADIGAVSLPQETNKKIQSGGTLSADEQTMVHRLADVTDRLLANIPRLEVVRAMVRKSLDPAAPIDAMVDADKRPVVERGADILRLAVRFDGIRMQGHSGVRAAAILRHDPGSIDAATLDLLGKCPVATEDETEVMSLKVAELFPGLVFAEDLTTTTGVLLIARGNTITETALERLRNRYASSIKEPVRVLRRLPSP